MVFIRYFCQNKRTDDGSNGLYCRQNAVPVACFLVAYGRGIGCLPNVFCNRACRVSPHILEGEPAEELHQSDRPKRFRRGFQKFEPVGFFLIRGDIDAVVAGVGFRIVFFDFEDCERAGNNQ